MKGITRWDSNGLFTSSDAVPDDYTLKDNETFDELPKDKMEPYRRVGGASGHWEGSTLEQYNAWRKQQQDAYYAAHPDEKPQEQGPSKQDQALNALGLQLAQVQKTQAAQSQAINALGLQFAQAQGKDDKTEQGGN